MPRGESTTEGRGGGVGGSNRSRGGDGRTGPGVGAPSGRGSFERRERARRQAEHDRASKVALTAVAGLSGIPAGLMLRGAKIIGPAITRGIEGVTGAKGTAPASAPASFSVGRGEGSRDRIKRGVVREEEEAAPPPAQSASQALAPPARTDLAVAEAGNEARKVESKKKGRRASVLTSGRGVTAPAPLGRPAARAATLLGG